MALTLTRPSDQLSLRGLTHARSSGIKHGPHIDSTFRPTIPPFAQSPTPSQRADCFPAPAPLPPIAPSPYAHDSTNPMEDLPQISRASDTPPPFAHTHGQSPPSRPATPCDPPAESPGARGKLPQHGGPPHPAGRCSAPRHPRPPPDCSPVSSGHPPPTTGST
jgi:hypothetical protein